MLQEVLLPRLGQTMEEGTIEAWHKSEGDTVKRGEVLYDLTTDKATLEVESFAEGVVKKILVQAGQTAPVNELVAIVGAEEDDLPEDLEAYRAQVTSVAPAEEPAVTQAAPAAAPAPTAPAAAPPTAPPARGRVFASPRARKLAKENRIPIAVLRGSGPKGRIIERDVLEHLERLAEIKFTPTARAAAFEAGIDLLTVPPSEPGARVTKEDVRTAVSAQAAAPQPGQRLALTAMRHTIAQRMTAAKQAVPHFYLVGDVLMRNAMQRRGELNASGRLHITVTDLLVRAAALALRAHPRFNARFTGDAIELNARANVGVAVSVEDGLFVPVINDADAKDLGEISAELKSLAASAREGKLRPEQYEGGCTTISNLGTFGVDYFMPIINPPESCILGIGRLAEQVVAQDGAIRIEQVMKVTLSADHRVTDGASAARFYATFRELLEDPGQL